LQLYVPQTPSRNQSVTDWQKKRLRTGRRVPSVKAHFSDLNRDSKLTPLLLLPPHTDVMLLHNSNTLGTIQVEFRKYESLED
jgi:hypothetical protein